MRPKRPVITCLVQWLHSRRTTPQCPDVDPDVGILSVAAAAQTRAIATTRGLQIAAVLLTGLSASLVPPGPTQDLVASSRQSSPAA